MGPTQLADIQPPPEHFDITLPDLKTRTREPVVIRCGRVSDLMLARLARAGKSGATYSDQMELAAEALVLAAMEPKVSHDGAGGTLAVEWLSFKDLGAVLEAIGESRGVDGPTKEFPAGDGGGAGVRDAG